MASINEALKSLGKPNLGSLAIFLLLGIGVYLTLRTRFIQVKGFPQSIRILTSGFPYPDARLASPNISRQLKGIGYRLTRSVGVATPSGWRRNYSVAASSAFIAETSV